MTGIVSGDVRAEVACRGDYVYFNAGWAYMSIVFYRRAKIRVASALRNA